MEPISATLLIQAVICGIVGNRSDAVLRQVISTVRNRLRQGGKPVNYDLQKAMRKAYLQATLALLDARLRELGVEPNLLKLLKRDIRLLFRQPDEPRALLKARKNVLKELRQIPKAAYIPPSSEAEQQIELLLQPRDGTAEQRVPELKAKLKEQLQSNLRNWGVEPSERLLEMIRDGWQEDTSRGEAVTLDWFDLLCAFFAEELKQNERVARILQSQLLANLSVEGVSVDYEAFTRQLEQLSGHALQQLQQVTDAIERLRQEQSEGFQSLQQRLDEYLPMLLGRAEQALELMQALARRRLLEERYAGLEIAQRTQQIIRDHTALFVGREQELEQLDALFAQPSGILLITAPAGYGKTALLANWVSLRHLDGCFIAYHFFRKEYDDVNRLDSLPNALYHLLRQLCVYYGIESEPSRDEGLLRDTLLGLIRERGAREDEPLVLLLDGLDEAESELQLTLPNPLPDGVYIVASTRADAQETPPCMHGWLRHAQRLHLQRLSHSAIAEYLARADDGALARWAQEEHFVAQVMQKTEGYPLYLRYLADELLQEAKSQGDVWAALQRAPRGFDAYVREQLRRLAQSLANAPAVQRLFALLATALGALSERDLETLAELNAFDLANLPYQATRWFAITERDGERFYTFTHPALGDAFEKALGRLAQEARRWLLDYCAQWASHKSEYALRHYAAHLKEAGELDTLFALARDEAFQQAQRTTLPAEPELPLRTLQIALQAAIERELPEQMAEMLLRHAHAATVLEETPLQALQQGNLERALGLAKQTMERDYKTGTLWLLLLAWNRQLAGDASSAERCLQELHEWRQGRILERLDFWQATAGAFLLSALSDQPLALTIAPHILDNAYFAEMALHLAKKGQFAQALEFAHQIEWTYRRAEALASIAQALAQAGAFDHALQAAEQIEGAYDRAEALASIAQALAQAGAFDDALEVATQIEEAFYRAKALVSIVQALAQAGAFDHALQVAQRIGRAEKRAEILQAIAQALAQMGQQEQAQVVIERAWQVANAHAQFSTLWRVAETAARSGFDDLAVAYAQQIAGERVTHLPKILDALREQGAKEAFLELLHLCAWYKATAVRACAGLIQFYPAHAGAIAEQILAWG